MVAFPKAIDDMNAVQYQLKEAWPKYKAASGTFKELHAKRVRTLWAHALRHAEAVLEWRIGSIRSGATKYTVKGAAELETSILEKTEPETIIASGLGKDFADLVAFCQKGKG